MSKKGKKSPKKVPEKAELEKLHSAAAKADEYLELARRTKAEFLNYQDRVRREKESIARFAVEDFIRGFLPAMDAMRESLRSARLGSGGESILKGLELMEKEFLRVLALGGVVPIQAGGKSFDPAFHEAVAVAEEEGAEADIVLEELRRGWMLHDRVLRPAQVKIARARQKSKED